MTRTCRQCGAAFEAMDWRRQLCMPCRRVRQSVGRPKVPADLTPEQIDRAFEAAPAVQRRQRLSEQDAWQQAPTAGLHRLIKG